MRQAWIAVLAALALMGCAERADAPSPSRLVDAACAYTIEGVQMRCARFETPEAADKPDGPRVSLPVVILKSRAKTPRPDPIVFLTGGPGGSAVAEMRYLAAMDELLAERDIILMEPRGNGESEPSLACASNEIAALQACAANLAARGYDLTQYDTRAVARDVAALRVAMGIAEWNVFGVSYGTRWALMLLRDHPEGLRSVVLDSVSPPAKNLIADDISGVLDGWTAIFEACARDPACTRLYPNVRQLFWEAVKAVDEKPIVLPEGGEVSGKVDGASMVALLGLAMKADPQLVGAAPAALTALKRGDAETALGLMQGEPGLPLSGFPEARASSIGAELTVFCREVFPFFAPDQIQTDEPWPPAFVARLVHPSAERCKAGAWPIAAADPSINAPTSSDVPVLLIAAQFDMLTRPKNARLAASTLSKATVVEAPNLAHAAAEDSPCVRQIMAAFLDAPNTAPDTACLSSTPAPVWLAPTN